MAEPEYKHEEVAVKPRGWRVRTTVTDGHRVRVAYPPGPRQRGAGRVISILHPPGENPAKHQGKWVVIYCPSETPAYRVIQSHEYGAEMQARGCRAVYRARTQAAAQEMADHLSQLTAAKGIGPLYPVEKRGKNPEPYTRMMYKGMRVHFEMAHSQLKRRSYWNYSIYNQRGEIMKNELGNEDLATLADAKAHARAVIDRHHYTGDWFANPKLGKASLTPQEDKAWIAAFNYYLDQGKTEAAADRLAWRDLVKEFPRLSAYSGAKPNPIGRGEAKSADGDSFTWWLHGKQIKVILYDHKTKRALEVWQIDFSLKADVLALFDVMERTSTLAVIRALDSLAGRRLRRFNPADDLDQAADLYRRFHGKDPSEVLRYQESDAARGQYTSLGDLVELIVKTPGKDDMRLGFKGAGVKLASSPDGRQLYLIGGDQAFADAQLRQFGTDAAKDMVDLGEAQAVVYQAAKDYTNFAPAEWNHKFGEDSGHRPRAFYDKLKRRIFLVGGTYRVERPGIVD